MKHQLFEQLTREKLDYIYRGAVFLVACLKYFRIYLHIYFSLSINVGTVTVFKLCRGYYSEYTFVVYQIW